MFIYIICRLSAKNLSQYKISNLAILTHLNTFFSPHQNPRVLTERFINKLNKFTYKVVSIPLYSENDSRSAIKSLGLAHLGIHAPLGDQLAVRPDLHNIACVEDEDAVSVANR